VGRIGLVRIAQVAPLQESVPPQFYGGTERVVSYLTEGLVELGHDVTLFASGDSATRARLVPICRQALRLDPHCLNSVPYEVLALEAAIGEADEFDVIHFHEACLHLPWTRRIPCATVTTMHGRLDLRDLEPLYREYADVPLVSIADAQREPMPWANWRATVYHGRPTTFIGSIPSRVDILPSLAAFARRSGSIARSRSQSVPVSS
jgi:glycosyltransferase involved in cell wall biosynthesis